MMQLQNLSLSSLSKNLLNFLHLSEKLKDVLRHGWTSTGRQESVADHCWRVSLMILLCAPYLDRQNADLLKMLKIALIHDLAEVFTGDVPYFLAPEGSIEKKKKKEEEQKAMHELKNQLVLALGKEIYDLWNEYEKAESYEAKVVKAVDKLEAQIQQNEADTSTWIAQEIIDAQAGYINKFCTFDTFLDTLSKKVVEESREIIEKTWNTNDNNCLSKEITRDNRSS